MNFMLFLTTAEGTNEGGSITFILSIIPGDNHYSFWCISFQSFVFFLHTFFLQNWNYLVQYVLQHNCNGCILFHHLHVPCFTELRWVSNFYYFFMTGKATCNLIKQLDLFYLAAIWLEWSSLFRTDSGNIWILI